MSCMRRLICRCMASIRIGPEGQRVCGTSTSGILPAPDVQAMAEEERTRSAECGRTDWDRRAEPLPAALEPRCTKDQGSQSQ